MLAWRRGAAGLLASPLIIVLFQLLTCFMIQAAQFGDQLLKCRVQDRANLDFCLMRMITDIRPRFRTGIPEVNVPVLDPMTIPNINVEENAALVHLKARFFQVMVRGASGFQPVNVHVEPRQNTVQLALHIPQLLIEGLYDVSGNVMVLPLQGNGNFWVDLHGIDANTLSAVQVEGDHLRVTNTDIKFNVKHIQLRLNNLFGGNSIVGDTVNRILNDNSQQLLESVKPRIAERISEAVRKILNDGFSNLPASSFLT